MRNIYRCLLTFCFIVATFLISTYAHTILVGKSFGQAAVAKDKKMLGLRLAVYHVNNIEKAKVWYGNVLGVKPNFDQPFYVGYTVGGFELGLVPEKPEKNDGAVKPAGVVAYWGVEDAKASYKRLIDLGAKPHDEVRDVGGGILAGTIVDPFGNQFGIIQNPYFKIE